MGGLAADRGGIRSVVLGASPRDGAIAILEGAGWTVLGQGGEAHVVTASLRGLELGEVVCAPDVQDASLLEAVSQADLAAFGGQSPELAQRYRAS
jgi:hypothetical protein